MFPVLNVWARSHTGVKGAVSTSLVIVTMDMMADDGTKFGIPDAATGTSC